MDLGIKGKRALVLGSSKGLGYATAHTLAGEGVDVAVSSSSLDRATEAAGTIAANTGAKVVPLLGDVSNPDNMNTLAAEAEAALGGIDILVNNHGGPPLGFAVDVKDADLVEQFDKMVRSIIRITSLALPGMIDRKWGRIVTISSAGNREPLDNMVLSNTLRGAIVNYTKTLATEVAKHNVTANIASPGSILTDRTRSSVATTAKRRGVSEEEVMAERVRSIPAGRLGEPREFAAMTAFLCSDLAGYCTGALYLADGGRTRSIV